MKTGDAMPYIEYIVYAIVLTITIYAIPLLVYLCMKMGTLGYLKAKERFSKEEGK